MQTQNRLVLFGYSWALAIVALSPIAKADFSQGPYDLQAADTIDIAVGIAPCAATNQMAVRLDLYLFSDGNNIGAIGTGYSWDYPNLQMDSAVLSPLADSVFDLASIVYDGGNLDSTNSYKHFSFGAFSMTAPCLSPFSQRRLLASYYFTLSNWSAGDSIVIDTLTWCPGTMFLMNTVGEIGVKELVPYWTGREVIYDTPLSCCVLRTGDANCMGGDEPTIGDVSAIIDYLFVSGNPPCCIPEADVNQSGGANPTLDDISIADCAYLNDYLFITGPSLGLPDCQ